MPEVTSSSCRGAVSLAKWKSRGAGAAEVAFALVRSTFHISLGRMGYPGHEEICKTWPTRQATGSRTELMDNTNVSRVMIVVRSLTVVIYCNIFCGCNSKS